MSDSNNHTKSSTHASQVFIRVVSVIYLLLAVVFLAMTALLAAGAVDFATPEIASGVNMVIAAAAVVGVLMLLLAITGFIAARDRFKVMPFMIVSIIGAVLLIAGQFLNEQGFGSNLQALALALLVLVSAIVAVSLKSYNGRHPKDEVVIPKAEYVPESMTASAPAHAAEPAAAAPVSAPAAQAAAPASAADSNEPLELRISSKFGSILHDKMEILDEHDNVIFRVASKAISVHDTTTIEDAAGNEVANFHAKLVSLHNRYFIEMADGVKFEMESEWFHVKDVINIDELGWRLSGDNMLEFNFEILDNAGNVVARCNRKMFDVLHDAYAVTIYDRAHTDEVVAIFTVVKHIIEHRQESNAGSAPAHTSA